jgi:hypothetical protein
MDEFWRMDEKNAVGHFFFACQPKDKKWITILFTYLFIFFRSHVHFKKKKKERIAKKDFTVQLKADPQGIISTMLSEGAFIASYEGCISRLDNFKMEINK